MTRREMSSKHFLGGNFMDTKKQQQKNPLQNPNPKTNPNFPKQEPSYNPNKGTPGQKKPGSNGGSSSNW